MLECMKKDKEKKNQYKLGNFDTTIRYQELISIHIDTTSIKESKSIRIQRIWGIIEMNFDNG